MVLKRALYLENAKSLKKVEGLTVIGVQNVREAIEVIYKR